MKTRISNFQFDNLYLFYLLAKYRSAKTAREELKISNFTLHFRMKRLQAEFGKLYSRTNQGVRLTPKGLDLYFFITDAMVRLEQARNITAFK